MVDIFTVEFIPIYANDILTIVLTRILYVITNVSMCLQVDKSCYLIKFISGICDKISMCSFTLSLFCVFFTLPEVILPCIVHDSICYSNGSVISISLSPGDVKFMSSSSTRYVRHSLMVFIAFTCILSMSRLRYWKRHECHTLHIIYNLLESRHVIHTPSPGHSPYIRFICESTGGTISDQPALL